MVCAVMYSVVCSLLRLDALDVCDFTSTCVPSGGTVSCHAPNSLAYILRCFMEHALSFFKQLACFPVQERLTWNTIQAPMLRLRSSRVTSEWIGRSLVRVSEREESPGSTEQDAG